MALHNIRGEQVAVVVVDDELKIELEVADVAVEPVVVGSYGRCGEEYLLCLQRVDLVMSASRSKCCVTCGGRSKPHT